MDLKIAEVIDKMTDNEKRKLLKYIKDKLKPQQQQQQQQQHIKVSNTVFFK
jgi:hypothetical protein